jgi:hypothetical protein
MILSRIFVFLLENLDCTWEIRGDDCGTSNDKCESFVSLQLARAHIWSGDFLRIFTDPDNNCRPDYPKNILLAQVSGFYEGGEFPPISATGCLLVQFKTDPNQERSYGAVNMGDGFLATYHRDNRDMSISECDGRSWGADCSFNAHCVGTTHIFLSGEEPQLFASSGLLIRSDFFDENPDVSASVTYPNDLDCTFEFQASGNQIFVLMEVYYDLESTHDLLWLQTGSVSSDFGVKPYAVLTGRHNTSNGQEDPERYYIPTDESGIASVRLTTDARGRRLGFYAQVRGVNDINAPNGNICERGYSGTFCEFPYCIAHNRLEKDVKSSQGLSSAYVLGRVTSQSNGRHVRPMPWSTDSGCVWPLISETTLSGVLSIRLVFHSPLDLEPYPVLAAGDKLIIRTNEEDSDFFIEQCDSNEMCSYPWQVMFYMFIVAHDSTYIHGIQFSLYHLLFPSDRDLRSIWWLHRA